MTTRRACLLALSAILLTSGAGAAPSDSIPTAVAPSEAREVVRGATQRSGDYDDLVALFFEFRAAQDSTNDAGVPDYSAAAIAGRYQEL